MCDYMCMSLSSSAFLTAIIQKLSKCSVTTLATVIIGTSSGDRTVTMFSGIIKDLVKDAEGASLPEKLLGAPAHKFHITPKDIVLLCY